MSYTNLTIEGMNKWGTGEHDTARKEGFDPHPVVRFGDQDYIILFPELIHPGHNTAEVVNVTEFDRRSKNFRVLVTEPYSKKHSVGDAWVSYGDEGGVFVLCIYTPQGTITDMEVRTAVLSYRIVEPTHDDLNEVRQMLEQEIENSIFADQVEVILAWEEKIRAEMPAFIRRLRQDRNWSQTELGQRLGVSQQYVAQLESGDRPATPELQQKLAAIAQEPPATPLEQLITGGLSPREIQLELARLTRQATGNIPRGQLWQPCDLPDCDAEPVCLNCLLCEETHCQCFKG